MANPLFVLGLGAGLMYLMDPQSGRRRRDELGRQLATARQRLEHARDTVARDATNRAHGLLSDTRQALEARRDGLGGPTLGDVVGGVAASWRQGRWSPAQRALAGATGAAIAMAGYLRGGLRGMALCAAGGAMVARASAHEPIRRTGDGAAMP